MDVADSGAMKIATLQSVHVILLHSASLMNVTVQSLCIVALLFFSGLHPRNFSPFSERTSIAFGCTRAVTSRAKRSRAGRSPAPTFTNFEGSEIPTKTKRINFRVSETMDALIRAKAQEAGMSLTDYIVFCAIDRKIVNYDRLRELTTQVKRLGSNVNQLLILSRQDRISTVNLTATQEELKRIHELLATQLHGR